MRRLSGVRRLVQGLNRTTPWAPVQTLSLFCATGRHRDESGWLSTSATGQIAKTPDSGSGYRAFHILPAGRTRPRAWP
jgi:hypothetical protein